MSDSRKMSLRKKDPALWYAFVLSTPLALFFVISSAIVIFFPTEDLLHATAFSVFFFGSAVAEFFLLQKKVLPNFVEVEKLRGLLAEQEQAGKLLIRRDLELSRANERLRKLDEIKSSFISVVAHQLRTPLSGIKWTLNLLLNGDMGAMRSEQKTFLLKAYESNERMISLVNDMLGADRIDSGKVRFSFQPVQLLDVVDSVLFELLPQATARGLAVTFASRPADLPKVHADPEKIRAVFQNLIDNSIKYSKPSGAIEIGLQSENHSTVLVSVKDNGIGIPQAQQRNIFERFFRARNAVKAQTEGSGLGLFIVQSIIERHGGRIWFKSEEGKGVTFFFTLPIERREAVAAQASRKNGVKLP